MVAKKSSKYESVRTGSDPRKDAINGSWLRIGGGEIVDVTALVEVEEILACEQCAIWLEDGNNSPVWVYTGPEDPCHDLNLDKRYRAYLPVLVEGESKVWSMGKSAHAQLLDIADAGGRLKGMELRIKRTGSGLATRYSIVPKGKRRDVSKVEEVDVIAMLGLLSPDGVREMLAEKLGKDSYEEVVDAYKGKPGRGTRAEARAKAGSYKKAEPEEDDLDGMELI